MSDGSIGRSEFTIRSTRGVEHTGSATDRQQRHPTRQQAQQERRNQGEPNRKKRRLYDLLFEEIDEIDALDPAQRARIKQNLRDHLVAHAPPAHAATPPPDHDEEDIAAGLIDNPAAAVPVDEDHIVRAAVPMHLDLSPHLSAENALLAKQLRACLNQRTTTARRVAVYLHLLLTLHGAMRPHMVVDA